MTKNDAGNNSYIQKTKQLLKAIPKKIKYLLQTLHLSW